MFVATIAATLVLGVAHFDDSPLKCAVLGSPTTAKSKAVEYEGIRFPFCCGGCPEAFTKEPAKYIAKAAKESGAIGISMFCPVSGERLDLDKVKATMDYKGIRYGFCCDSCPTEFKANPEKYVKVPPKESLVCPVSGEKIASYSAAAGYVDYQGVRYYACCSNCLPAMKKDIAKVLEAGKAKVTTPVAMTATNAKPETHGGG